MEDLSVWTIAAVLLTVSGVSALVSYWAGVSSERYRTRRAQQRARYLAHDLGVLEHRYAYMKDLNQSLASEVSKLRTGRPILGVAWSSSTDFDTDRK